MSRRIHSVLALVAVVAIIIAGFAIVYLASPSVAQQQPSVIVARFSVSPNDAIAPHLYMWYFNGYDAYLNVPYSAALPDKPWTIAGWFMFPLGAPADRLFVQKNPSASDYDYGLKIDSYGCVAVCFKDTYNIDRCVKYSVDIRDGKWHHWAGTYDGVNYLRLYEAGGLIASSDVTGLQIKTSTTGLSIAFGLNGYSKFYSRQVLLYSAALSGTELMDVSGSNIIRSSNLVLFLDPTFYNGSHYKDLSTKNHVAISFGGVARLKDSNMWLYLIVGRFDDNKVHFMFFPFGTKITIIDAATGAVVKAFTINATANNADLVEDYPIDLASGTYDIYAELPPTTVTSTVTSTQTVTSTSTVTETQTVTSTSTVTDTVTVTATSIAVETVTSTVTETQTVTETVTATTYVELLPTTVTETQTATTTTVVEVPVTFTSTVTRTSYFAVYRTATVTETQTVTAVGMAAGWAVIIVALSVIGLAIAFLIARSRK